MKVLTGWDTEKGICLVTKESGKRAMSYIDYDEWYFYILKEDLPKAKDILNVYRAGGLIRDAEILDTHIKIYAKHEVKQEPSLITLRAAFERADVQVFEFDLTKTKRYIIDNNVEIETELSKLYFDIETDDTIVGLMVGRDRILSWAAIDDQGKVFYESGDEKTILEKFVKLIQKYDIISGWNSDQFDLPYIQIRCEKHNIKYKWRSLLHVDMMQRCFKIYSYEANIIGLKNFSLDEVARAFLDKKKVEHEGFKIHELFESYPDKLKEYNIQDAQLLYDLDTKLNIIELMIQECKWTGTFLNKFYIGELLDNYILRSAKQKNKILESRASDAQLEELEKISIAGGFVAKPILGVYKHVNICDFKSLYPSIIVGWNIGIDSLDRILTVDGANALTKVLEGRKIEEMPFTEWQTFLQAEKRRLDPHNEYIQTANNAFFKRSVPSFIGDLVENLLNERKEYKKKLKILEFDTPEYNNTFAAERVVKEMANSMFGITCEKRSRYFNKSVSEGITYTGQYLNKMTSWLVEQFGLKSIYGDTDSIFVVGIDDLEPKIEEINNVLREKLDTDVGLRKNIVYLEYEKHFSHLILLEKKRYTGILTMKDGKAINKIFSRGTEDVKKGNLKLSKQTFNELTLKLFDDNFTVKDAIEYIKQLRYKLAYDIIDPEHLVLVNRVSKQIEHYKTLSLHARLAKRLIKTKVILPIVESAKKVGTRLEFIVVDVNGKNEGILLSEFKGEWHREYYWQVQIYAPLKRLLKIAHPTVDWDKFDELIEQPTLF